MLILIGGLLYTAFMRLLILLLAAAFTAPAADAPFTGKWQIHINIGGTERDFSCDLAQKDAELTGTCVTDNGTVKITGKAEEKKATWTYKSEYQGSPLTVTFRGSLEAADKMTGTVVAEEFGAEGEFTATQAK